MGERGVTVCARVQVKSALGAKVVELDQKLSEAVQSCQELHRSKVGWEEHARVLVLTFRAVVAVFTFLTTSR